MNLADGFEAVMRAAAEGARPDPELKVDEWSEQHMVLPKSSSEPGPYRIERTPYARRVMQCLSPGHPCKRVVVRGASQMLKTQVAINWILASIHLAPANILALEPTDKLAKRLSARLGQSIRDVDVVRDRVATPRSRDSRNTIDAKDFQGGALYIVTAGAASNLAEIPARYVFLDEVDRMEQSVDGEGDPVELSEARATTFQSNCKFYEVSSPTVKGLSKIDTLHDMGTQEVYLVPCPHCGHEHELVIGNFRYQRDPDTGYMVRAWFVCPECGCEIEERSKGAMLAAGRWHARAQGDGETVSFSISAFYAKPGDITWLSLARQHARALDRLERGDPQAMQVFWNTRLALSFEHAQGATTAKELQDRAESYPPRVVPDPALVLTMTVDTQPNRLEVQIEAWGPGMEHWLIDHTVLWGSPAEPPDAPGSVWARLDEIRRTPFAHTAGGKPLQISAYAIDSGGANTQDVYNYGARRKHLNCLVIKGANRPNRPIISSSPSKVDIEWNGQKTEGGVELWMVGTDVAKDHLFNRMKLAAGPGAMHFHDKLEASWFEQLVAERPRVRFSKGRAIREWVKANGDRNEALDLSVYNLAVAYYLGLHKWGALDWARLREKLVPKHFTRDLFAAQPDGQTTVALDAPAAAAPATVGPQPAQPPAADLTGHQLAAEPNLSGPVQPPTPADGTVPASFQAPRGRRILSRGLA